MKPSPIFVGIDFETTGLDPLRHGPVQVGIAIFDDEVTSGVRMVLETLLRPRVDPAYEIEPEAMAVHGIPWERLMDKRTPTTWEVDERLADFLGNYGVSHQAVDDRGNPNLIPVGWNVGSFDMAFCNEHLPATARMFHPYRSFDLNSACMTIAGGDFRAVKDATYRYVAATAELARGLGTPLGEPHSAGFDAWAALITARQLWKMTEDASLCPADLLG